MSQASKKLGLKIRKFRAELNMTQAQFAKKLKVDTAYLSNLENGNKNPTIDTIEKIAKSLGVSIEELIK